MPSVLAQTGSESPTAGAGVTEGRRILDRDRHDVFKRLRDVAAVVTAELSLFTLFTCSTDAVGSALHVGRCPETGCLSACQCEAPREHRIWTGSEAL